MVMVKKLLKGRRLFRSPFPHHTTGFAGGMVIAFYILYVLNVLTKITIRVYA